ncbi:MAG: hypothetical protein M3P48_01680 [Actinomycetota bacterium]|nr:hypothetical protein [Actinomycetota bacterium]
MTRSRKSPGVANNTSAVSERSSSVAWSSTLRNTSSVSGVLVTTWLNW